MRKCHIHNTDLLPVWVQKNHSTRLEYLCDKCDNLIKYQFKCSKCGWENLLVEFGGKEKLTVKVCQACQGTGKRTLTRTLFQQNIPSWRLNIDDCSPEKVLNSSPDDFGMKGKSSEEWTDYYENSPWEKEKMKKFNEEKKQLIKETLGSIDSARLPNTE